MMKELIIGLMHEVAAASGLTLVPTLNDHTPLLESGLDSLTFAALVMRLEEELGFDPFVQMDGLEYPRTLDDFVKIYERFRSGHP